MEKPSVSVVMPLFNKENYIARALKSVLFQSFRAFEIIVVDDGSTDAGAEIVQSFHDPRLRLIRQGNGGVSLARNRGVMDAKAEYVAFIDADDEWHPEFLSTMWAVKTASPHGRFFASAYEIVYSDGVRKSPNFGYPDSFSMDLLEFMDCCMRLKSPIMSSAVMVHKPLLEQVGLFPVGQKRGEDLDTWVRLLFEVPLIYCNQPLAVYWYGLPFSTCVSCQDIFLEENKLLQCLEEKIQQGSYQGKDRERVLDYIAWYTAGPVERLIAAGRCAEARRYILSSLRSKRLRKRYLIAYFKSFYPPLYKRILISTLARP
jgi:glycosyltransferase involved in cell wall biosynthesis